MLKIVLFHIGLYEMLLKNSVVYHVLITAYGSLSYTFYQTKCSSLSHRNSFLNLWNWFHSIVITIFLVCFIDQKCQNNLRVAAECAEVYVSISQPDMHYLAWYFNFIRLFVLFLLQTSWCFFPLEVFCFRGKILNTDKYSHGVKMLCVSLPCLPAFESVNYFLWKLFKLYAFGGHYNSVLFNFVHFVISILWTYRLVRWEWRLI
jgi:hypothetical protein